MQSFNLIIVNQYCWKVEITSHQIGYYVIKKLKDFKKFRSTRLHLSRYHKT